jgi:hypothetical protein
MRTQGPLHEGHLAEAVRRGLIHDDQREAILAMVRSESIGAGGNVPDLRWTVVVQGIAAVLTAVVPGIALLSRMDEESSVVLLLLSITAAVLFGALGRVVRARGWGRVAASIFTAAIAPYVGGAAMFALKARWRGVLDRQGPSEILSEVADGAIYGTLLATGVLVAIATSWLITRQRPNGPAWSTPAVGIYPLALSARLMFFDGAVSDVGWCALFVTTAIVGLTAAWALRPHMQRGGVDGAAWFELGAFAPLLAILEERVARHPDERGWWFLAALMVATGGVVARRWTYQLVGALGLLGAVLVGLRRETINTRTGVILALSVLLAVAAHWMRRFEARRARQEAPTAPMTYWE